MLLDALVVVVILVLAFTGMWFGWRARRRRQADVPTLATPPAELGEVRRREDLLYVATTRADAPLDRIAVHGLGFRARAQLTVAASGSTSRGSGRPSSPRPTSSASAVPPGPSTAP